MSKYDDILLANERELWAMTENHGKLCAYVRDELWSRISVYLTPDLRAAMAEELREMGCEVK